MDSPKADAKSARGDAWVPSACALCYGSSSILVHRVDGAVVKIEGNPDSAVGKGRLCGKGVSDLMCHDDPNRLRVPLRRTNPNKGLDEDPRRKQISWEEALDEIAAVLKRVRAEVPRKLLIQRTTTLTCGYERISLRGMVSGTVCRLLKADGFSCCARQARKEFA